MSQGFVYKYLQAVRVTAWLRRDSMLLIGAERSAVERVHIAALNLLVVLYNAARLFIHEALRHEQVMLLSDLPLVGNDYSLKLHHAKARRFSYGRRFHCAVSSSFTANQVGSTGELDVGLGAQLPTT